MAQSSVCVDVHFMDVEFYLVSYGRLNEICVVLSWASQSQVPRKLSKPSKIPGGVV